MKKFLLSIATIAIVSLTATPAFSFSSNNNYGDVAGKEKAGKEMTIVPDRKSGEMTVRFKSSNEATATITVKDEAGKVVLQQTNQLSTGVNNLPITNSLKLAEGTYTLSLVVNSQTYSSSFLIWQ